MASVSGIALGRHLRRLAAAQCPSQLSDGYLLQQFIAEHDQAAFAALVARHGKMVLAVCWGVLRHQQDAEDVFQATFLVLARSAASIRKQPSLASWLHGVAYRLACKARAKAAGRATRERLMQLPAQSSSADEPGLRELRAILDDQLQRLPERYRGPILLCCCEGKSREEGALQLGLSTAAFQKRLERGRKLLAHRLAARGLAPSAALALALGSDSAVTAALSSELADHTVTAAVQSVTHATVATGHVSSVAVTLAQDAGRYLPGAIMDLAGRSLMTLGSQFTRGFIAMYLKTKIGIVATLVLVVGALCGIALYRAWIAPAAEVAWAAQQPLDQVPRAARIELSGRVVKPDGTPAAGARVAAVSGLRTDFADGAPRATTDSDGNFRLSLPRGEFILYLGASQSVNVVAVADGFGMAWKPASVFLPKEERANRSQEPVLRLTKDDTPLIGQLKTAQGRPVAGAHVVLSGIYSNDKGDLGPWLAAVGKGEAFYQATDRCLNRRLFGPGLSRIAATTDADGHFQLNGIGQNRVAELRVWGPTAACRTVLARTAPGEKVGINGSSFFPPADGVCYGRDMTLTIAPSRPIEGVVTDADSGAALAGALVQTVAFARSNQVFPIDIMEASMEVRTDATGRFHVEGLPIGEDNRLLIRPRGELPYLPATVEVDTSKGDGPAKVQVKTRRGVWVVGQVTDAKTNRPLFARIDVFCPEKNLHAARYPNYTWILTGTLCQTDGAGKFRVPAIPGRAVIAACLVGTGPEYGAETTTQAGRKYRPLSVATKIEGLPAERFDGRYFSVQPTSLEIRHYHQIHSLEIPADAPSVSCDLKVE
jgi:RNA polymerase sigma factor (sigma-70 family)